MFRSLFRTAPPSAEQWITLPHPGGAWRVLVRPSARARRYTLRVRPADGAIVLTMPARGSLSTAQAFAARHIGWIEARLAKLPRRVTFAPGAVLPLRGRDHTVVHRPGTRGTVWTETDETGVALIVVAGAIEHLPRRIGDFLRREARRELEAAAQRHAATLGVTIRRITIKDTVSRWGSCSADGALSFSWRLILAPPQVLSYLAAHEVAHRREMNHSARYWSILRRLDPGTDEAEAWLKRHGSALLRYGD